MRTQQPMVSSERGVHHVLWAMFVAVMVAALACSAPANIQPDIEEDIRQDLQWVGTWATAPISLPADEPPIPALVDRTLTMPLPSQISSQTLRQGVRTSIGGSRVRVAFTNQYGTEPLQVGAAHVALRDADSLIVEGSGGPLTFDGQTSATIETGSTLLSDAVEFAILRWPTSRSTSIFPGTRSPTRLPRRFTAQA